VNDRVFLEFYGRGRSRIEALSSSLKLFRRVKPVYVALNAGPDQVSLAVELAASKPHAVIFPYRLREGAERYFRDHPEVPAAVLGETTFAAGGTAGLSWFFTDTPADLYRAGRLAALCALADTDAQEGEPVAGEILYFGEPPAGGGRGAFERGLSEQGFSGVPRYIQPDSEYNPPEEGPSVAREEPPGDEFPG
jgi:hypothetical protein